MFKKIIAVLLVSFMLAALMACGGKTEAPGSTISPDIESKTPDASPPATSDSTGTPENIPENVPENTPENTPESAAPAVHDKDSAYAAYALVASKLAVESGDEAQYDIDFKMLMDMSYGEDAAEFDMSGNLKMKDVGGKIQYAMNIDMSDYGVFDMYSDGDKAYISIGGEVQEIDMSDFMQQVSSSVSIPDFEKDAILSCETRESGGNTIINMVIDGTVLSEYVTGAVGGQLAGLGDSFALDISDVTMSITTDSNGNPKAMDMDMSLKMTLEGEEMTINTICEYTFNKLGSGVDIDLSGITAA